jgi:integrase
MDSNLQKLQNIIESNFGADALKLFETDVVYGAENTITNYVSRLCFVHEFNEQIPCTSEDVANLIRKLHSTEYSASTISSIVAAVFWLNNILGHKLTRTTQINYALKTVRRSKPSPAMKGGHIINREGRLALFTHLQDLIDSNTREIARLENLELGTKSEQVTVNNSINRLRKEVFIAARDLVAFTILTYSGVRIETVCSMRFEDIRTVEQVDVEQVDVEQGNKYAHQFVLRVNKTDRTGHGVKTGWILETPSVASIFSLKHNLDQLKKILGDDTGFILRTKGSINPIRTRALQQRFANYAKILGITCSLHAFRSTFVTNALNKGVSANNVMQITRHRKEETLRTHYHGVDDQQAIAVELVL